MTTYAVQHPNMSNALLIDDSAGRTDQALREWASLYVLRYWDEMLPLDEFVVREVPAGTDDDYSIFDPTKEETA